MNRPTPPQLAARFLPTPPDRTGPATNSSQERVTGAWWRIELPGHLPGMVASDGTWVQVQLHRENGAEYAATLPRMFALHTGYTLHDLAEPLPLSAATTALLRLASVYISAARWGAPLPGYVPAGDLEPGMVVEPLGCSGVAAWVKVEHLDSALSPKGKREAWVSRLGADVPAHEPPYLMVFVDVPGGYQLAPMSTAVELVKQTPRFR